MIKKTFTLITFSTILLIVLNHSCKKEEECIANTYYQDADGDGYGNTNNSIFSCTQPTGFVLNNFDFNDTDADLHPEASDIIDNHVDENGDGFYDYNLFLDNDNDGFGSTTTGLYQSPQVIVSIYDIPTGYSLNNYDCDDNNSSINPNAQEILNNLIDENCDGDLGTCTSNNDCGLGEVCINGTCETAVIYYLDNDGDGEGGNTTITAGSTPPQGYVTNNSDCDDSDSSVCTNCTEVQNNGIDDDCDGLVDECPSNIECNCNDGLDNDGDGFTDCSDSDCTGISGC